jgi:hypothetical protein
MVYKGGISDEEKKNQPRVYDCVSVPGPVGIDDDLSSGLVGYELLQE